MGENVVKLAQVGPSSPAVQPSRSDRWLRKRFKGIKAETLVSAVTKAEGGELEDLADLYAFMLRDHHVRATYSTLLQAITGAELVIDPGIAAEGQESAAEQAAEFVRRSFDSTPDFESVITGLAHAEGVGWALAQHRFKRVKGEWHSHPWIVEPRDVAFTPEWLVKVRTYDDPARSSGTWRTIRTNPGEEEFDRAAFIAHVPRKLDRPTVAGDLLAVAWAWLFRRWCELFRQQGLEKFASPFIIGRLPPNAPDAVKVALKSALENLSSDQVAIMEDGSSIEYQEAAGRPGDAWTEAISAWNREITKALLGSDINTEVGSSGGNRALAESQFTTTILPRLESIARRLGGTLERDWAAPLLRLNAHLFGGTIPPTPTIGFQLVNEKPPEVPTDAVAAGLRVRQNEWRRSFGLPELTAEEGGDAFAVPSVAAAPDEARPAMASEVAAPIPFGRGQMSLPLTSAQRKSLGTSSGSATRTGSVPFGTSGGHEK